MFVSVKSASFELNLFVGVVFATDHQPTTETIAYTFVAMMSIATHDPRTCVVPSVVVRCMYRSPREYRCVFTLYIAV